MRAILTTSLSCVTLTDVSVFVSQLRWQDTDWQKSLWKHWRHTATGNYLNTDRRNNVHQLIYMNKSRPTRVDKQFTSFYKLSAGRFKFVLMSANVIFITQIFQVFISAQYVWVLLTFMAAQCKGNIKLKKIIWRCSLVNYLRIALRCYPGHRYSHHLEGNGNLLRKMIKCILGRTANKSWYQL